MAQGKSGWTVNVLAIFSSEEDRVALRRIFTHCNWTLGFAADLGEARTLLGNGETGVVMCDCDAPERTDWRLLLKELEGQTNPPPLIVSSAQADDRLWAEVLNLGGYDLLMKPFDAQEVSRVLSLAWRGWAERQRRLIPSETAGRPSSGQPSLTI